MARWLIETWEALPRVAEAHLRERSWFDVKITYGPGSHAEMAKDVAAFANAWGGALIVGASESLTGPDYSHPLSQEYAVKIEAEFDQAVRDFCRPSPVVHIRAIPAPDIDGKVVLVVNVEPVVDQPVAARHATNQHMWSFPMRVGRDTEFIMPEQLPLYVNSKARRAKLLLLRALDGGGEIDFFMVPDGPAKHSHIQGADAFMLEAVDSDGSGSFIMRDHRGDLGGQRVTIPLDDVEAVWLQHTGRWAVRVAGRLEQFTAFDNSSVDKLTYTPPGTFVVSPLGSIMQQLSKNVQDIQRALRGTLAVEQHARTEPCDSEIAARAYQLWQIRLQHNVRGTAEGDWLQARRQILNARRD